MTPKAALDSIALSLSRIDVHLSGEDSPLTNPWEEIKEQIQHEPSLYWPAYVETMRQFVGGYVAGLTADALSELSASLKRAGAANVERELMRRLLLRAKKERIRYSPFDFTFFCYRLLDFTAYGQILERTGMYECRARVYSVAAPSGEEGGLDTQRIDAVLSKEQFESARNAGWPEVWHGHG